MHTMEYDLDVKIKDILTHAPFQVNLEGIILSEINQSKKYWYCMISLTLGTKNTQIHIYIESRMDITRTMWRTGIII